MVNTPNTVGSRRILVVWIGSAIGETHPLRHCDDRRQASNDDGQHVMGHYLFRDVLVATAPLRCGTEDRPTDGAVARSEEHTSELQSRQYLVCRLLLEKKKNKITGH